MGIGIICLGRQDATRYECCVGRGYVGDHGAAGGAGSALVATAQAGRIDSVVVRGALIKVVQGERQAGRGGVAQT